MGERLMYAPSLGLALLLAILLARTRRWKIVLIAVALIFRRTHGHPQSRLA